MSAEPSPGHLGREPLAPVTARGSAESSPSPNVQSGPGHLGRASLAPTHARDSAERPTSHVTLWSGLLDDVGSTLIRAGRDLARAEEAMDGIDDALRVEAELYAALADGLAARLRSL